MFSGHVEIIILKFSPASATKVRLPGRGRRKGRRDGVVLFGPPTSKCVATALCTTDILTPASRAKVHSGCTEGLRNRFQQQPPTSGK